MIKHIRPYVESVIEANRDFEKEFNRGISLDEGRYIFDSMNFAMEELSKQRFSFKIPGVVKFDYSKNRGTAKGLPANFGPETPQHIVKDRLRQRSYKVEGYEKFKPKEPKEVVETQPKRVRETLAVIELPSLFAKFKK